MSSPTVIPTDLITPLGAYIRLRGEGQAAFLLESVEQGRLGRHSFIGAGARVVSLEEAERQDASPVVGYLAYDHVARLEPTVPLPPDGPSHPESRFIVADTLVRFDHAAGLAEVVCGDPDELRVRLDAPRAADPGGPGDAPGRHGGTRTVRTTSVPSRRRRSTSTPGTPSRSSSPSARSAPPPRARSSSTGRYAASIRRRISSCSSSTTWP